MLTRQVGGAGEPILFRPCTRRGGRRETHGAFDPTVGHQWNRAGSIASTARRACTPIEQHGSRVTDVVVDAGENTITLLRPLIPTWRRGQGTGGRYRGARAAPCDNFAIDAGGDLYLAGFRAPGPVVGISHLEDGRLSDTIRSPSRGVHVRRLRTRVPAAVDITFSIRAPADQPICGERHRRRADGDARRRDRERRAVLGRGKGPAFDRVVWMVVDRPRWSYATQGDRLRTQSETGEAGDAIRRFLRAKGLLLIIRGLTVGRPWAKASSGRAAR
jgi:hypothetical protein